MVTSAPNALITLCFKDLLASCGKCHYGDLHVANFRKRYHGSLK